MFPNSKNPACTQSPDSSISTNTRSLRPIPMNGDHAHVEVGKLRKGILVEIESVVRTTHAPVHDHRINGRTVWTGDFHLLAAVGRIIPVDGRQGCAVDACGKGLERRRCKHLRTKEDDEKEDDPRNQKKGVVTCLDFICARQYIHRVNGVPCRFYREFSGDCGGERRKSDDEFAVHLVDVCLFKESVLSSSRETEVSGSKKSELKGV